MTEPNEAEALLPCPFCGGQAYIAHEESRIFGVRVLYPSCLDTECTGFVIEPPVAWPTERQASAAWNRRLVREDVRPELRDTIREINVRLGNCDPLEDATRPELDEGFDDRSYLASTDEMLDRLEADMVEESPTPDEARSSARTSPGADGRQAPTPTVNVPHVVYDQKMPPYHYQKPEFGSGSVSAPTQPEPAQMTGLDNESYDTCFPQPSQVKRKTWN